MAYPAQTDPTKVIGRRVLATLIDAALVLVPSILLVTSSLEYISEENLDRTGTEFCDAYLDTEGGFCFDLTDVDDRVYFTDGAPGASSLVYWGLTLGMLVVLQGLTGWTIGKLVTGIRTVREDGRPPGLLKALLRWLLWVVDAFPYFLPLVGFITALTTVGHRRVGDMAAGTYVVRASAAGSPIVVPGLTAPPPPPGYVSGVPWGTTAPPPPAPGSAWGRPASAEPEAGEGNESRGESAPEDSSDRDPYADWQTPSSPSTAGAGSTAEGQSTGWGMESETPAPTPAAPPPQWDEARGTYIQWDPAQGAWLQWDEPTRAWIKIPGQ